MRRMIRKWMAFFCIAALLTGCSVGNLLKKEEPEPELPSEDLHIVEMCNNLRALQSIEFEFRGLGFNSVESSKELADVMVETLQGGCEPIETETLPSGAVTLDFLAFTDNPEFPATRAKLYYCGSGHKEYPNQTVLWLQNENDPEVSKYVYSGDRVSPIKEQALENRIDSVVDLEGDYIPLTEVEKITGSVVGMLQFDEDLLFCVAGTTGVTAVRFRPADGTIVYTKQTSGTFIRVEKYEGDPYDYRLYTSKGITYFDFDNPEITLQYEIPKNILPETLSLSAALNGSIFDAAPVVSECAYVGKDGVYMAKLSGSGAKMVLDHREAAQLVGMEDLEAQHTQMRCYFVTPRLMCGGEKLVCAIAEPFTPRNPAGLIIYDTVTGEKTAILDVFTGNTDLCLRYDDDTLVTYGGGGTRSFIDVWAAQSEPVSIAAQKSSVTQYIAAEAPDPATVILEDRSKRHTVRLEARDNNGGGEPELLLTATGGSFNVRTLTEDYILCRCRESGNMQKLILVEY